MKQLILPVSLDERATFDNFVCDRNEAVVESLRALVTTAAEPQVLLWGPAQRGKSHLLRAACRLAVDLGRTARYVALGELLPAGTDALAGLEDVDVLCVDDIHLGFLKPDWAVGLFHLINASRDGGCRLVLASATHPAAEPLPLPDLQSRLLWGPVFRLHAPGDAALLELLRGRAAARGVEIPLDAARYLMSRCRREVGSLLRLVDSLDSETLARHRSKVTVPFIKSVLGL